VLDCSGLEFLSISALRSLDVCAAAAQVAGHQFVVARPAPHVARLLAVAGLAHLQQCRLRT
jgi:anti-anti-sigma regulatory factor